MLILADRVGLGLEAGVDNILFMIVSRSVDLLRKNEHVVKVGSGPEFCTDLEISVAISLTQHPIVRKSRSIQKTTNPGDELKAGIPGPGTGNSFCIKQGLGLG